jgi:anti-sigma factor RsiW
MNPCDEYHVKTLRYLDDDLQGHELIDFRNHLKACAECRASLEAEQALSNLLHRSRPLYRAPAALRSRVSAAVTEHSESKPVHIGLYHRALEVVERQLVQPARRLLSRRVLAFVAVLLASFFAFIPNVVRQVRAASFVETAVTAHRGYLNGDRPLELRSSSPELVTAWFAGKVPFAFRLPNAQVSPNETPSYRLTGASVVNYHGNPVALVTYEKRSEKICLLAAPSTSAPVAGGDEVRFGDLTFHYRTDGGFKVITWSNHGLSYALVSSVSGSARESCLVCHQNMADYHTFRPGQ